MVDPIRGTPELTERTFAEFVRFAEPRLRVALMAAYGADRGREAAAEALAYAWEHWDRVRLIEKPIGYLYRVGQSRTRRWWSKPPPVRPTDARQEPPWVEPALPAALQDLSRRQRMAVVLVHGFGWTHEEAAELIGVSTPTVKTHVQRALAKLRSALEVNDE